MENHNIHILMASDNEYGLLTVTSIASALYRKCKSSQYQFHLLISDDFGDYWCSAIRKLLIRYDMPEADLIKMGDAFQDVKMHIPHITFATYYRLRAASLLPSVDKCIYLDADTIICDDLTSLYDIDMLNCYLSGVKAAFAYYPVSAAARIRRNLGISIQDPYINAGVLLMDLRAIRENDIEQKFLDLLSENFGGQDQDILNSACRGHIQILPLRYNLMTKYPVEMTDEYHDMPCVPVCYSLSEWEDGIKNPCIIHYADKEKPWSHPGCRRANQWWDVFEQIYASLDNEKEWFTQYLKFYRYSQVKLIRAHKKFIHAHEEFIQSKKYRLAETLIVPLKIGRKLKKGVRCFFNCVQEFFLGKH